MDALQVNVYLTSHCTRYGRNRCSDCYYPIDGKMSRHMAMDIGVWINKLAKIENVKLFKAHFLGGEPLLNPDALLMLLILLHDLPSHPDGKFVIFTNGDLLDEYILKVLKRWQVKILLNPTNLPLDEVRRRMELIKSVCGGVSLAIVADMANLARLRDLAELAVEFNGHIRINRLYHGGSISGYVEEFGRQMHKVFDVLLSSKFVMWPNFILESTYPLWEGPKNCHSCGKWLLIIDPNGDIRSCNADMDTKIGHISTHTRMSDFKFPQRWSSKNLEECKGCEWANGGWCQGGCPLSRKLAFGTYNHKTPFCEVYKTLFPRLQELVTRWKEKHGLE